MKLSRIILLGLCLGIVLVSVEGSRKKSSRSRDRDRSISKSESESGESKSGSGSGSDEDFVSGESLRDCTCSDRLRPVCGSDKKTYKSTCVFQCYKKKEKNKRLYIKNKRACKGSQEDDGKESDSNEQGLLGTNIKTAKLAKTRTKQHGCDCTQQYRPVCASDKKSYDNECLMKCRSKKENVRVKYSGQCESDRLLGTSDELIAGAGLLTGGGGSKKKKG